MNNQNEHQYAGFWIRFLAMFIDGLILSIPTFALIFFAAAKEFASFDMLTAAQEFDDVESGASLIANLILMVITIGYYVVLESSSKKATLGKMVVGIQVVDVDGEQISFLRSLGRYFSKILSSIFYIGYIMAGLTERKQGLHDMIAKTYVVYKPRE